jgi:hypothetical protein
MASIKKHFATALSRLLNAFQAGSFGGIPIGVVLVRMLLASQARSVSKVNGLLFKDNLEPCPVYMPAITEGLLADRFRV